MARVLTFLVLILGLVGCGQKPQPKPEILINMENITAQNIVEKVFKKVKHYQ